MTQNNGSCGCGHTIENTTTQELTLTAKPEHALDATAECPVMAGTPVIKADAESKGLFRDYDGQRYWFCCAGCGPKFDADPARYVTTA
ncbi:MULTISPECIES: YHS domain-containing protein [Micrococcaceae]|jgi:YHS domain-containing protein|uniref:YHS domain-containing protein n=3 Tax=Micrococcaceae TaxID=1268 RepID=Q6SK43_PAEAU|nr:MULTISPECIES: YHS domain-containing protein [Micrococcaceae]AAS20129.1 hypothetical protein [Paenarthrobacter aurescens]ABM10459.1 YHS domain protein [Paenarthrobacter aurescens TC1]SDQ03442.1 YHS domain-containing protein [Arthrobacter crystallopoietes]